MAVPHSLDDLCLLRCEQFAASAPIRPRARAADRPAIVRSRTSSFSNCAKRRKEVEHQPAGSRARIELLFETNEVNATLVELVDDTKEVTNRAAKPVQSARRPAYRLCRAAPGTSPALVAPAKRRSPSPGRCACIPPCANQAADLLCSGLPSRHGRTQSPCTDATTNVHSGSYDSDLGKERVSA